MSARKLPGTPALPQWPCRCPAQPSSVGPCRAGNNQPIKSTCLCARRLPFGQIVFLALEILYGAAGVGDIRGTGMYVRVTPVCVPFTFSKQMLCHWRDLKKNGNVPPVQEPTVLFVQEYTKPGWITGLDPETYTTKRKKGSDHTESPV